jgi:hypothetical protein
MHGCYDLFSILCSLHPLCCAAGITFGAERLNALGAKHWERFSRQDYFDSRGVFFSVLVSGPLVLVMLLVLVSTWEFDHWNLFAGDDPQKNAHRR